MKHTQVERTTKSGLPTIFSVLRPNAA